MRPNLRTKKTSPRAYIFLSPKTKERLKEWCLEQHAFICDAADLAIEDFLEKYKKGR